MSTTRVVIWDFLCDVCEICLSVTRGDSFDNGYVMTKKDAEQVIRQEGWTVIGPHHACPVQSCLREVTRRHDKRVAR
jgi:hypothetical protein